MKIGIAQIRPIKGYISANIAKHKMLAERASSFNASAIFFPELSLTSYEPKFAKDLASNQDDNRLDELQEISNNKKITIGVGMPTKTKTGIQISMIIFLPHKPRQIYSKQQLHLDELPFFTTGNQQIILTVDNLRIAPAICYESLQSHHSYNTKKLGADVYLASVAKSQNGVDMAMKHFPEVAKKNSMYVLMSNCIGYCDNFESVGNSSVWSKEGLLLAKLDSKNEGLIIFDTETEKIIEQTV